MLTTMRTRTVLVMATAAVGIGTALFGNVAHADTTLSPGATVDGTDGGSCFSVVLANATFNANGTPKSVSGGSVTFDRPVSDCV